MEIHILLKLNLLKSSLNNLESKLELIKTAFLVEKELLIALMGIETNYGKYLGKMDIVSSLSTSLL